jgi:hypothetical protein
LADLRQQLRPVDSALYFSKFEKQALAQQMSSRGWDARQPITLSLSGRAKTLLAVFDPKTLQIVALLRAPTPPPFKLHAAARPTEASQSTARTGRHG